MNKFMACLTGVVVTLAGNGSAFAQNNATTSAVDAVEDLKLEEVVVTAERVTKDLQKVSQVISTYSGEQLKKEAKTRVDEILQGLVGIQMQSDQVDTTIYMRGITGSVPVIVDGVSQGSGGTTVRGTTLDLAQVQVARGVQNGAGTTSLTGSVSLVTNKPAFEYQASGSLTAGNFNLRNTEAVVNLPVSDNQAMRVAYSADRRNGYYSNGAGDSDNREFRVRYRYKPSENIDITGSFQENRTEGNGVSVSTLLYTGHWIDYTAGQSLTWTNPYVAGSTPTVWGATAPASNWLIQQGLVNAGNASGTAASVSSGNVLSSGNQYLYNAGPCNVVATATTSNATTLTALGPIITTMGCPVRQIALRDGVSYADRSNPWDDGFRAYQWSNSPVRNTLNRQANVIIDWETSYGNWEIQPAYIWNVNQFVEPARGTSWMEQGFIPSTSYRLDAQLSSKSDSKLQWVAGLNGSYSPRSDDGTTFKTTAMPVNGWVTGTAGMSANQAIATSCYTVLPTGATTAGISNSAPCETVNYTASAKSFNYAASIQGSYPVLDTLRLNGSYRHDWYNSENRGTAFDTLIDGNGQRYVWYLPATNYVAATTANPNSLFQVPYRMNISQADIDAQIGAVSGWRRSQTDTFTLNVEYDLFPTAMVYAKYATGATGAMAAGMGGATGGTVTVVLPDAKLPVGVTGAGNAYSTTVTLPAPSVKGETTQQATLGLKSRWLDNRLQANVEAFYNKYKNRALNQLLSGLYSYTATATTGSNQTCTASATDPIVAKIGSTLLNSCFATNIGSYTGNMLSKGVDLDVTWATATDRADMQVEYLRALFDGVPQLPALTSDDVLANSAIHSGGADTTIAQYFADNYNNFLGPIDGKVLQNTPRWSVNLSYEHQFRLPNGSRLTPRVIGYYKSAVYFSESLQNGSNANITEGNWAIDSDHWLPSVQKGYHLYDFYTTFEPKDGKWTLTGFVKNLQNKPILQSTSGLQTVSTGSVATNDLYRTVVGGYANLAAPRTFGLTLSANF